MNAENNHTAETTSRGVTRYIVKNTIFGLLYFAILFGSAGTLNWIWGWVVILTLVLNQIILTTTLYHKNPELLAERSQSPENAKEWDKPLSLIVGLVGPAVIMLVSGLDYRFGWTPELPLAVHIAAIPFLLLGVGIGIWAILTNSFFSPQVRIQSERGHKVIKDGPYAIIRHPGYNGALLYDTALPFVLGSWWALLPAVLTDIVIFVRTYREDETLQDELDGYKGYTQETRYRLIPKIW